MNFVDPFYGIFLLVLLLVYWHYGRFQPEVALQHQGDTPVQVSLDQPSATTHRWRCGILLGASLLFYAFFQIQYIPLLLAIAALNFWFGKAMAARSRGGLDSQYARLSNQEWEEVQRLWNARAAQLLGLGIVANVLLLIGFKYIPFLLRTAAGFFGIFQLGGLADWFRQQLALPLSENLIAPLGISFFTFECVAYLVDVYRGAPPARNLLDFASYKLFFPKLISGPITRYHQFAAQVNNIRRPQTEQFAEGVWLIACGVFKKVLIADQLGIFVDLCFGAGNLERAGSLDLWLAVLAYGLQLFFDFSGYVDMARGTAMLFGFNLPENFDFPYFTTSIADFWRRWHMTLGDWLRNYLYFPLGGSRRGLQRTCINLVVVMAIAGIWHGAAWGFVIWGLLHGLALVVHRLTDFYSQEDPELAAWWRSIPGTLSAWLCTQALVFFSWIFFRLPDVKQASLVLWHSIGYAGDVQFAQKVYAEALGLGRPDLIWLLVGLMAAMAIAFAIQRGLRLQLTWHLKLMLVPLCFFTVWMLAPEGGLRYIYFDF